MVVVQPLTMTCWQRSQNCLVCEIRNQHAHYSIFGWWFGTWTLFFHRLGITTPTDFHLFQRGRYTTNQILLHMCDARLVKINAIPQHFFQIHHPVLQSFHCNQMTDEKRSAKSQVLSFGWFLTIHICTYTNCRYFSIVYIYITAFDSISPYSH